MKVKILNKKRTYLPLRFLMAVSNTALIIIGVISLIIYVCVKMPLLLLTALPLQVYCAFKITATDDNPNYKQPWLILIFLLPFLGATLYFFFYSRKLSKKYTRRLNELKTLYYSTEDGRELKKLRNDAPLYATHAQTLKRISCSNLFTGTSQKYFSSGEQYIQSLLTDLNTAQKFIFLEYFIIEDGKLWRSIKEILISKAKSGVDVKILYDDFGCIFKNFSKERKDLKKYGVTALPFSKLKWLLNGEFNNRNHRKIAVIDGKIGYTGGVNLADEYINAKEMQGVWKDCGIRLYGNAVWELTNLFIMDFGSCQTPNINYELYPQTFNNAKGYVLPFGDGAKPLYTQNVSKRAIINLLSTATRSAYITTPYLIIDSELCSAIEFTAMRGVTVKIILPGIPDKPKIFQTTKSFYPRLLSAGVEIYEYKEGFIHSKIYLADDINAIIGTVNLDYRSLAHHFENAVWLYDTACIKDIKTDIVKTLKNSDKIDRESIKDNKPTKIKRAIYRVFAPLL